MTFKESDHLEQVDVGILKMRKARWGGEPLPRPAAFFFELVFLRLVWCGELSAIFRRNSSK